MTILAGKTWTQRLINRHRARRALGAQLLRQDDRMLDDIGLTRADLGRALGLWQDRAGCAASGSWQAPPGASLPGSGGNDPHRRGAALPARRYLTPGRAA